MMKLKKEARTANSTTSINPIAVLAAIKDLPEAPLMHMGQPR